MNTRPHSWGSVLAAGRQPSLRARTGAPELSGYAASIFKSTALCLGLITMEIEIIINIS